MIKLVENVIKDYGIAERKKGKQWEKKEKNERPR